MKSLRLTVNVFAFTALTVAAGCGSSHGSDPLTKEDFIKQGDAICRNVDKVQEIGVAAYAKSHPSLNVNSKAGEETMVLQAGLPPIATAAKQIEELDPPAGDEKKLEAIVEGWHQGLELGERDPTAIIERTSNPFGKSDRLAADYGFKDCSEIL